MIFLNHNFFPYRNTFVSTLVCLFFWMNGNAQSGSNIRINVEDLYSTHGNHFPGISASYNRVFSKKWEIGLGIEYSYTPKHDDNGWNLYHLNFIPVYLQEYFNIGTYGRWTPYVHLQEGLSITWYDKEFQDRPGERFKVRERGFYGYGGAGSSFALSKKSGLFLEIGMKGFHLSFNNLDVNPHGFTSKLGYVYRLK